MELCFHERILWLEKNNNIGSFRPIRTFDRKALGITAAATAVNTCELYANFSWKFERKSIWKWLHQPLHLLQIEGAKIRHLKKSTRKVGILSNLQKKGNNYAYCSICSADFSIAASGRYGIKKHIATAKHRSSVECKETNRPITQFLSSLSTNYDVIRAETLWTLYIVDNNMPFTSSDGFCDVVKTMFPDSKLPKILLVAEPKPLPLQGHDRK